MANLGLVLLVFGFVFFVIAGWRDEVDKPKLIAIGLAFITAAEVFGGISHILGYH